MSQKLIVSPSPHVHSPFSTERIMCDVVIALLPALMVSARLYGMRVLGVAAFSIACCVLVEYLVQKFMMKGELTITNLSAVVTGLLLAMNLPASIPLWIVAVGAVVAIGVAKMPFGGLGKNPFNPAITARVFLLVAYPVQMTHFEVPDSVVDAFSGATALSAMKNGLVNPADVDCVKLLVGAQSGSMGEIAAIALLLGMVYLLYRKVITWHIPVSVLGTMAVYAAIVAIFRFDTPHMVASFSAFHLLAGGAILGAVYMATDYSTSPMTKKGMLIYGFGIGALTMTIRLFGSYPEGMSFAILIMNAVVPLINKYVKPRRFGF